MSCTATSCPSTACVCCHVTNVAVDNTLVVGGSSTLTTNCETGGALTVSSCVTQTSGELAKVTGEAGQVAFAVDTGRVVLDPNDALDTASPGVEIKNTGTQAGGQLVQITGDADQVALHVATGLTALDANSPSGQALTVSNSTAHSSNALVSMTANSSLGKALVVTNATPQSDGELVHIIGTSKETALQVTSGETVLNPDSDNGGALIIANDTPQTSGELVLITGTAGETALNIETGDVEFGGTLDVAGEITGDVTGTVSSLANHDTDDLTEGTANLYFTDARVQDAILQTHITLADLQSEVAASTDFADFQSRIAEL